jgi:hypothetical protein
MLDRSFLGVLRGLGDALEEKQKAWAKDHLVPETILEMKKRITPL